jgi:hypothetical protein
MLLNDAFFTVYVNRVELFGKIITESKWVIRKLSWPVSKYYLMNSFGSLAPCEICLVTAEVSEV